MDLHFSELTIHDALAAGFWLCGNVMLVAACWRLVGRLFPPADLLERLCHMLVLAWAALVASATSLAICALFSGAILLVAVVLLAGAVLACLHFFGPQTLPGVDRAPDREVLTRSVRSTLAERSWMIAWIGLCGLWLGQLILAGLLRFPTNWDPRLPYSPRRPLAASGKPPNHPVRALVQSGQQLSFGRCGRWRHSRAISW